MANILTVYSPEKKCWIEVATDRLNIAFFSDYHDIPTKFNHMEVDLEEFGFVHTNGVLRYPGISWPTGTRKPGKKEIRSFLDAQVGLLKKNGFQKEKNL